MGRARPAAEAPPGAHPLLPWPPRRPGFSPTPRGPHRPAPRPPQAAPPSRHRAAPAGGQAAEDRHPALPRRLRRGDPLRPLSRARSRQSPGRRGPLLAGHDRFLPGNGRWAGKGGKVGLSAAGFLPPSRQRPANLAGLGRRNGREEGGIGNGAGKKRSSAATDCRPLPGIPGKDKPSRI